MGMNFSLQTHIFLLILTILLKPGNASIHVYNQESLNEVGNSYLLSGGSEGIFSSSDSRSFVRFDNITFWRPKSAAKSRGLIQVVVFEAADRNNIGGSAYGGQRSICCTSDLSKLQGCKQGEVLRIPSTNDINWPVILKLHFSRNSLSTSMKNHEEVRISKTGMYNLFFIACDPKLKGVVMSGKTVWRNSNGYLPGRMAPLMRFYVFMSLVYFLLAVIWFTQYIRFRKDILQLQHCISVVVGLGLFEMILWYLEYANFNSTGMRPVVLTSWVVTVGAVRKTIARLLVLCVSMGYGVVRPYSWWSYLQALSRTLEQLQVKRSAVKLDIYRKFTNALAAVVFVSVAWIGYELYFKATDPFNERWQSAWIITAFWDVLAFALLCVICYLWAPSQSSQRYAYSEELGEEFDEEEAQSLTREKPDGDISLVETKDKSAGGTHVLDEDDGEAEEDKRE
ncbi:LUNG SEVEN TRANSMEMBRANE RECEPTOR [Salix purpurea]|uniref:LUNG SEVEN TRANSMEMBRANE RECEPTOR n=1 Tax=Salix purpurea TaxID=77065 RepID=A0A9Q0YV83_SALPP|nr:LUNG SEVEN TRANSMEMBRANE RECEPTOR [Salix purpurea]